MGSSNFSVSFFLSLFIVLNLLRIVQMKTHWGDVKALKELKNGVDFNSMIPGSCLSSWDFGADPCDSLLSETFTCGFRCGVTVGGLSRVTELALDPAGYVGSIGSVPWENLHYLENLELSMNSFSGPVPGSLGNLTRLTRLALSSNSFSGSIPASIGSISSLEEMQLDNNYFEGAIPVTFNGLTSLKRLEIQSNKFSGEFPDLGSLQNLNFLDASNNEISGSLPANLPPSLVEFSMRNNSLQGRIPQNFKNLKVLQVIELSQNKFADFVPYFFFTHSSLQQLSLSSNYFTSVQSPANLGLQSELVAIDLSNNQLRGFLPPFFAMMPKLSALSLENNKFTGMIPIHYALRTIFPGIGVSQLERLFLGGNYLFGPIPAPLMALKPGAANVRLVDNCLFRCPNVFFFCQGGDQKSEMECKSFSPVIP